MIPVNILYNRLSSSSLLPWVEAIDLVERVSGRASTLSVTLCNADGRFLGPWQATRGDSLSVAVSPASPDVYAIRKITTRRAPAVVVWEAEGRPATSKAPSGRGAGTPPPAHGALVEDKRSWPEPVRGKRLREIAERVCAECGLRLEYVAKSNPVIPHAARLNETGFHLLDRYCRRYALTLRANAGAVTILSMQAREDKSPPSSVAIPVQSLVDFSQAQSVAPRSVRSARFDPRTAKPVRLSAGDGAGVDVDCTFDAESAQALYAAAVAQADTATVEVVPTAGIVAGSICDIAGLGLREVVELRYTRTGDAERMTLTVREL